MCVCVWASSHGQRITLTLDDLTGSGFSARDIRVEFLGGNAKGAVVAIGVGALTVGAQSWKELKLTCAALKLEAEISCDDGVLLLGEKIPIQFKYVPKARALEVTLLPAPDENYRISVRPSSGTKPGNDVSVQVAGGRLLRVAPWLPKDLPKLASGALAGVVDYMADGRLAAKLTASNVAFADVAGLHAGEKIGFSLDAAAQPAGNTLAWQAALTWSTGEVFWQPLYLKAQQQQLTATGRLNEQQVQVEQGVLRYPGVGNAEFSATYALAAKKLSSGRVVARDIDVAALYESVLKPFLDGTAFSDLRTEGKIAAEVRLDGNGLRAVDVNLARVSFEDKTQHRFALFGLDGVVPWRADEATLAQVGAKGGELLKMPLGAFNLPLEMNGPRFAVKQMRVPLLDGHVDVRDFVARAGEDSWYWQFTGGVAGISMERFTTALGLPAMHGTMAATLPMVSNTKSALRVDGALSLNVFDGAIAVNNLVLLDVFGKAPRVQADVVMKNLDLGLVTSAFSFGNITGRIDTQVSGLELVNWQPVKFDVKLASSAGDYPRKISQAAVQNITALGGAGAAAAIQRSFLRFFEQFGYDKLGWGCKLSNGVCEMSGVEDTPQGYVIVKGGGIPAITVMGYNRQVSWDELLSRLKRVTQGGVKPIVQ